MYFLASDFNICLVQETRPVWNVVGIVIDAIWIGIPLLLIVLGMFDLGKAVISSKDDEIKKSTKTLGRRFLYAVAVFAIVWLVQALMNIISSLKLDSVDSESLNQWKYCWCRIKDNCKITLEEGNELFGTSSTNEWLEWAQGYYVEKK